MSVLRITAHLRTPIASRQPVQLDAILLHAHPDLEGKAASRSTPPEALSEPSISVHRIRFAGTRVFLCSGWRLPPEAKRGVEHIVKRKAPEDLDVLERSWNPALGPGKNRCVPVPLTLTPSVSWLAVGKRQGVKRLLRYARHVGGLRAHGYGIVSRWEIEDLRDEDPLAALLTVDGHAARHLPASWVVGSPPSDSGAWLPPYWHPSRIGRRIPAGVRCELKPEIISKVRACR